MREALAGLTVRGRAFLAAGVTIIVSAMVVGNDTVIRIGVLVAVLPLLATLAVGRSRYQLSLARSMHPQMVSVGQPARVDITLTNEGRTPTGALRLEERLPYVLGGRPRFLVEGMGHLWRRHAHYVVRSDVRGQFDVGPMTVRVSDPFGMVELGRSFTSSIPLIVTPRVVALPAIGVGGAWTGSGDNRPRAFAGGSAEDVTVREYRRGDDLRRVHWRSSARVGQLMVRREEQPWQSRATVYLDNRAIAHRGQGVASSFETAVSAAASVAVHLTQRGYSVRLVTATGESLAGEWHSRSAEVSTGALLEALAVVEAERNPHQSTAWLTESAQGGLTVAVFGALGQPDLPFLKRLRHHSTSAMALVLDVDRWAGHRAPTPNQSPVTLLGGMGWRAVALAPGEPLEAAWETLGRLALRQQVGA